VAVADIPEVKAPVVEEKTKKETAPKAEEKKVEAPKTESVEADDLKKLEGVGPKLAEILAEGGFATFAAIAAASVEEIQKVLETAGSRYASKDPAPWIEQAKGLV
jgi:predicted flap endonuclease-1-like 5' DNA nuclease